MSVTSAWMDASLRTMEIHLRLVYESALRQKSNSLTQSSAVSTAIPAHADGTPPESHAALTLSFFCRVAALGRSRKRCCWSTADT